MQIDEYEINKKMNINLLYPIKNRGKNKIMIKMSTRPYFF